MAYSSQIGESIRRFAFEELINSAAHLFCWMCSFVNKCNTLKDDVFAIAEDMWGIASLKYPGECGHCYGKACTCDPIRMDRKKDKAASYERLLEERKIFHYKDYTIEESRRLFYQIFGGRIHIQSLETIGFHFLEEVGEAAICVRQLSQLSHIASNPETGIGLDFLKELSTVEGIVKCYSKYCKGEHIVDLKSKKPDVLKRRIVDAKMGLIIELGDSFSWFFAILNKLMLISESVYEKPKDHEEIIMAMEKTLSRIYINPTTHEAHCYHCLSKPCRCTFYNVLPSKSNATLCKT